MERPHEHIYKICFQLLIVEHFYMVKRYNLLPQSLLRKWMDSVVTHSWVQSIGEGCDDFYKVVFNNLANGKR